MDLDDRLKLARPDRTATDRSDPLDALRDRLHADLIETLGPLLLEDRPLDQQRERVRAEIQSRLASERGLSASERRGLLEDLLDGMLGHGPIERLLADDEVTEIMANGPHDVFVERAGRITRAPVRFADDAHLRLVINRIVNRVGRRVDESSPMVDARLPDGSRVNAVLPPVALDGPILTIRRFGETRLSLPQMAESGTLTEEAAQFLDACLHARLNILISGGTGSGKTTMLNALSAYIPETERIVTIEDAAELRLEQAHVLRLESRPRNLEGEGEITIRDLVRNALRMRPDRIIVGEVRGAETLDMLQAMNTGHDGSLSTIHANSPRDSLARIETMVLMAGFELPLKAIRQQIASALELVIHLERAETGLRRVTSITEVLRMEGDIVTLQDLFELDDDGRLRRTALQPACAHRFARRGVLMPARVPALAAFGRPA